MWAVVGGTVLSAVAQIVATETLSEGISRSTRNDIWKDTSGEAENMLAQGEGDVVGPDKHSGICINSVRRNSGFDCCRSF